MAETLGKKAYDILVVGGGPSGASAARAAAQMGVEVLIIDRKQRIGVPVQCAEFVSQWVSRHASFSSASIQQTIDAMLTHLPDGSVHEMKGPGYMLDRSHFDRELAVSAIRAGARILTGTKAAGLSAGDVLIKSGEGQATIKAKVVIGADGARSAVARGIGLPHPRSVVALQVETVLSSPQKHAEVFFSPEYEGGYAWFFPKGKTANVGLGVSARKAFQLPRLLDLHLRCLMAEKGLSRFEVVGKTAGVIPCEVLGSAIRGKVMLVGDAAGHAHPVTGAGIFNAVLGGEIAGRIAAESVLKGDAAHLESYDAEWRRAFGDSLAYGALKRAFLEEHWSGPDHSFEDLIRKTWVGFREYYKDRRRGEPWNKE